MVKVSVIIPTYGKPVFLQNGIESIINQTLTDWELIVVDDNNPETIERIQTEALLKKYTERDARIKYIQHAKNLNGAVARNTGLAKAQGMYVAFLDSDDEYLPERLSKCSKALDSAPSEVAGIYTGCQFKKKGKEFNRITNTPSGNFLVETLA